MVRSQRKGPKNNVYRWALGTVGLVVLLVSLLQIRRASRGLETIPLRSTVLPAKIVAPLDVVPGSRPVVLIGHGFAGSAQVMRGFALSLAHAGYVAVLWDFDGHGANPYSWNAGPLIANAEVALAEAQSLGWVTPGRVAILGHSMGSGVALEFGQTHPDTAATVAVSPVGRQVTPTLPRNLLLLAGSLETPFVRNAEQRLVEAGGAGGDPAQGTARKLVVIPGVEHMSILFAPATHAAVVAWMDATFGPQQGAMSYTDRRMLWYGLGILGALLIGSVLSPVHREPAAAQEKVRPLWRRLAALTVGALAATLVLWIAERLGLKLQSLLGMLVGGYLMIWFGVAGTVSMLLLGARQRLPSHLAVVGGGIGFAVLWLSVGLIGHFVWYPWLLIWPRLRLWPLGTLLLMPWFKAVEQTIGSAGVVGQLGRWLTQNVVLVAGLLLALRLSTGLGFLSLILPAFPAILALHALGAAPHRRPWSFALSGALFTSWVVLAIFPLQ